jgi:hypothetical protein
MDTNSPSVQLCIEGTRAEFERRPDDARALFWKAWETAQDDYEACIAAHYVARFQTTPHDTLRWNLEALARADALTDGRAQSFYPSLYVNLGHSYEMLGNQAEANRYYQLAADLGLIHDAGE